MVAQYGDFHYKKISVKESGKIVARGKHNERTRETPNADPDRLHENVRLAGSGDWLADVQARADEATFTRANSVLALDVTFYVSRGFFDDKPPAVLDEWARRTMEWAPGRAEGHSQGQEDDRAPGRGRGHAPSRDEPSRG